MRTRIIERIQDQIIRQIRERYFMMSSYEKDSEELLYFLKSQPQTGSHASFDIRASKGEIEAFNINNLPDIAIDLIRLKKGSRTDTTAINRSILFKPVIGNCILLYADKNGSYKKELDDSKHYGIESGTQFSILTNGSDCELVLLLGKDKNER